MKLARESACMMFIFVMGNMVGAGVMRVLGDIVTGLGLTEYLSAWIVCGVVSVGAALLFLDGGIRWGVKLLRSI